MAQRIPAAVRARDAFRRTLLACVVLLHSCTATEDVRVGIGGRGAATIVSEPFWEDDGDHNGILIDGTWYDLRGRAADVTASIGGPHVQALAGYEWSQKGDETFQARLFGVRVVAADPDDDSGPYAIVLGRAVDGSGSRTPYFDGLDLGIGFLGRLTGALFGDVSVYWAYVDGDALPHGVDSINEFRVALGLRFEF